MTADVGHDRRGCALILIDGASPATRSSAGCLRSAAIKPIVFQHERPFAAGELDTPLVAGIGGRCRFEGAESAVRELEQRDGRVFDLDLMERRLRSRRSPAIPDQISTAANRRCECPDSSARRRRRAPTCLAIGTGCSSRVADTISPAPTPAAVVRSARRARRACSRTMSGCARSWKNTPSLTLARSHASIKASARRAETSMGFSVSTWRPRCGGADALLGVQSRWAADRDEIHRLVRQKGVEVRVRPRVMRRGESIDALRVGTMDRDDFDVARSPRPRARASR